MFNLYKHAEGGTLDGALDGLGGALDQAIELTDPAETSDIGSQDLGAALTPEQQAAASDTAMVNKWNRLVYEFGNISPKVFNAIQSMPDFNAWNPKINAASNFAPAVLEEDKLQGAEHPYSQVSDRESEPFLARARDLKNLIERQEEEQALYNQRAAFNLKNHKAAQIMPQPMGQIPPAQPTEQMSSAQPMPQPMATPQEEPEGQFGRFPVDNVGDFLSKFGDDLLNYQNAPGTAEYASGKQAIEEILSAVSPANEEEANSILESVVQLDITEKETAQKSLIKLYQVLLPGMLKNDEAVETMEPVMSEKNTDAVEGIVRYNLNLDDQILNNKKADGDSMVKTAADQFGQQYLLYGPSEKRICPKLRGKNMSVGDIVSEYTCRHHCIDGIAIDDNKTICGEALWRANAMDKYSREYRNADGEIEGGYLNKRFQTDRNVPEENKMQLKPGETRKPRPPAWGSTESRLQDMRAKEGQKRDYRPDVNTGDAFEWCHDSDQNNVEQTQKTRDSREEASGHKLVQYTNRDQGENNSKKAFNLKMHKSAQLPMNPKPMDFHMQEVNPAAIKKKKMPLPADVSGGGFDSGKPMLAPEKPMPGAGPDINTVLSSIETAQTVEDLDSIWLRAQEELGHAGGLTFEKITQAIANKKNELGNVGNNPAPMMAPPSPMAPMASGFNLKRHNKLAELPHPHKAHEIEIDFKDQVGPKDFHTPKVKPAKKKT